MTHTLPGFANPVDDAQAVFRAVLDAFAHPGLPVTLELPLFPLPAGGLSPGMLALALSLCDQDTPLWLDESADTPETRHHLRFHCASPLVTQPNAASFAFIARPKTMPRLREFNRGRQEYPDRSSTLVLGADLSFSQGPTLELTGPGVKGNDQGLWRGLRLSGLPAWFWDDWEENHIAHPLGVDVVFVGSPGIRLLGLPRTTRVRLATNEEDRACM